MKRITDILKDSGIVKIVGSTDIQVNSLQLDSRMAEPGCLFFAVRGTSSDGHHFISGAIDKGAEGVVCETLPEHMQEGVCYLVTDDSRRSLGKMAASFYGDPSTQLKLIGVTGTNGKTTIVTLLHRLFMDSGIHAGLISTIENRINDIVLPATHTTPDPIRINELLSRMTEEGCTHCFMEVSSHAVDQRRIEGLTFAGGIFTNLTHDHLDYHKTFDAYLKAKKGFFDCLPLLAFALVNKDDRNGMVMLQNTTAVKYTYSLHSAADFHCKIMENQFSGLQLNFEGQDVWFRLTGIFNAYNLLAVYAAAILLGQDRNEVLIHLSRMEPVNGRFNTFRSTGGITAIVDYAHTPDALQRVLETINVIRGEEGQLITVVGAGGNRDTAKRPVMARIASDLSDRVILTTDNPRFEEPEAILAEMGKGVDKDKEKNVLVIADRREAIRTACALAHRGDIILVAGKGHENYQEIKGIRFPFDDKEIVKQILSH